MPEIEFRCVGVRGLLRRMRSLSEERRWSMMFPRELVCKFLLEVLPRVGLWAFKSPQRMKGDGSDNMREEMSLDEVLWDGGMYRKQKVIGRL